MSDVCEYRMVKLIYHDMYELAMRLSNLRASKIISVKAAAPDETTDAQCVEVYYEYAV